MSITPAALASELDVSELTVDTLTGVLQDQDLYNAETGLLSADGAELIRDQIASGE